MSNRIYIESVKTLTTKLYNTAFKSLYTIYAIDLSAQKETIKSNWVDTSLYIERVESEEVDTYCLLLEETELQINTDNGVIISLT